MNDFGLQGKIVIITGAKGSIGDALCIGFVDQGATVVGFDLLEGSTPSGVECRNLDISDSVAVDAAISAVENSVGPIDIVVNNAGLRPIGLLEDHTDQMIEQALAVNLQGTIFVSRAVVPLFKERRSGKLLNISSLSGRRGHPTGGAAYAAAKGGVIALTKSIAMEVAGFGINVNCIAPGPIDTPLYRQNSEDVRRRHLKSIPLGRVGLPEDVVGPALLLTSRMGSFIHGQTINVDGGIRME